MLDRRGIDAVEQERDRTGGIRLERQARHVVHEFDLLHVFARAGRVERNGGTDVRFGFVFPFARHGHALFELAHAGEILIETFPIPRPHVSLQIFGLVCHHIENALSEI